MGTREKVGRYIELWENRCYRRGIPDEAPVEIHNLVPSYKRIALALLNNDVGLVDLGYKAKKSKYYDEIKYNELKKTKNIQLRLF